MSVFCVDNVRDIFVYFQGYGIFRKINYGPLGYLSIYLKGYRILAGFLQGIWLLVPPLPIQASASLAQKLAHSTTCTVLLVRNPNSRKCQNWGLPYMILPRRFGAFFIDTSILEIYETGVGSIKIKPAKVIKIAAIQDGRKNVY